MTVFVLFVALVVFVAIVNTMVKKQKIKETRARVAQKFSPDECLVSDEDGSVIGLNFREQKIVLGTGGYEAEYGWEQIASIELVRNGATLQQTDRGSQIGSALIGGVLFGGVGALVGGLTGSSVANVLVKELALKVIVDDRVRPIYVVTFYKSKSQKGSEAKAPLLLKAQARAERFHAHLVNAMRSARTQQTQASSSQVAQPDQIQQLWTLKEQGALTAEEFQTQKACLLAGRKLPELSSEKLPPETGFSLVLYSAQNKIQAIRSLRRNMEGLSLSNAKSLVDKMPSFVNRGMTEAEASQLLSALAINGLMAATKLDGEVSSDQAHTASASPPVQPAVQIVAGLMLAGVVLAFGAFLVHAFSSPNAPLIATAASTKAPAPISNAISVSAAKLVRAYSQNEIEADSIYKGKILLVKGNVRSVDEDFSGSPLLQLSVGNKILSLQVILRPSETTKAATLETNQSVSLLCRGEGKILQHPVVDECLIQ